jgi:hypothetical protein
MGKTYTPKPAQNRVTEIVNDRSIIDEESHLTKENSRDELMKLEEGFRAEVLEEMIAQDFSMGPN